MVHTPRLWRHVSRPVQFSLVVDDFGVKYVGKENAKHLIKAIKKAGYEVALDWEGSLYCRKTLECYDERWLDISMPGYIDKLLKRHDHTKPVQSHHSPHQPPPRKYREVSQDLIL